MYVELVTDRQRRTRHAFLAWVATLLTCGYLLPWAVAATRGKANEPAVAAINLFLGWTVIGWFVALSMACGRHRFAGLRLYDDRILPR